MRRAILFLVLFGLALPARAADKPLTWGLVVDDPVTAKECGACHFAFPPVALPVRSWAKLMANLKNHFGEDASLSAATQNHIAAYLKAHAADTMTQGLGPYYNQDIDGQTPLRITDLPVWKATHYDGVLTDDLKAEIKTWSNCLACHPNAGDGDFYGE